MTIAVRSDPWGLVEGQDVRLWSLSRDTDLGPMSICVAEHGATLQSVIVPDHAGVLRDVVVGHGNLAATSHRTPMSAPSWRALPTGSGKGW